MSPELAENESLAQQAEVTRSLDASSCVQIGLVQTFPK